MIEFLLVLFPQSYNCDFILNKIVPEVANCSQSRFNLFDFADTLKETAWVSLEIRFLLRIIP